ncbi:MAG: N-6 DNA methylase [Crinalium sp.]
MDNQNNDLLVKVTELQDKYRSRMRRYRGMVDDSEMGKLPGLPPPILSQHNGKKIKLEEGSAAERLQIFRNAASTSRLITFYEQLNNQWEETQDAEKFELLMLLQQVLQEKEWLDSRPVEEYAYKIPETTFVVQEPVPEIIAVEVGDSFPDKSLEEIQAIAHQRGIRKKYIHDFLGQSDSNTDLSRQNWVDAIAAYEKHYGETAIVLFEHISVGDILCQIALDRTTQKITPKKALVLEVIDTPLPEKGDGVIGRKIAMKDAGLDSDDASETPAIAITPGKPSNVWLCRQVRHIEPDTPVVELIEVTPPEEVQKPLEEVMAVEVIEPETILPERSFELMGGLSRSTEAIRDKRISANLSAESILEQLSDEEILANPEAIQAIAAYSGVGGTDQSHLNSYYTEGDICHFMWRMVQRMGYSGGLVLEPSCGSGNFLYHAPKSFLVHGIEIEPTPARIARLLYGDRHVVEQLPFQDFYPRAIRATLKKNKYDLVIGNPPYGAFGVTENIATSNLLYDESSGKLEQMIILASLNLLTVGGLLCMVVPHTVISGKDPIRMKFRETVHVKGGKFLGAVRLPNTAHKAAGTSVITDIIFILKTTSRPKYKLDTTFLKGTYFDLDCGNILGEEGDRKGREKDSVVYDVVGKLTTQNLLEAENLSSKFRPGLRETAPPPFAGRKVNLGDRSFEFEDCQWREIHLSSKLDVDFSDLGLNSDPQTIPAFIEKVTDPFYLTNISAEEASKVLELLKTM